MANENPVGIEETVATAAPVRAAAATAAPVPEVRAAVRAAEPGAAGATNNLDMILDVNLKVTVELGRTRLKVRDILNLSAGSVVELNRTASEPVDILVNGALLASGEVVVVDDNFAVRITKLLSRAERLKKLF